MTEATEKQKAALSALSPEALADFLSETFDAGTDEDSDSAWDAELERRFQDMESGRVCGVPAEKVFAELRKKYEQSDRPSS